MRCRWIADRRPIIQVKGEAQGTQDNLILFVKDLNQGPRHAQVVKLDKEGIELHSDEASFEVR